MAAPTNKTDLSVHVRFALPGLLTDPAALGTSYEWQQDAHHITLALPLQPGDFHRENDPRDEPVIPSCMPPARAGHNAIVHLIKVQANFEGSINLPDEAVVRAAVTQGDETSLAGFTQQARQLWQEGHKAAERAAHEWLTQLRVTARQPWLGESIRTPKQYGLSELFETASGRRLLAFSTWKRALLGATSLAVSHKDLTAIQGNLSSGHAPEAADVFLADARILVTDTELNDPRRAVLLAGMACEIKTKLTLRSKVDPAKAPLLDLVLRRQSQLSSLVDAPLMAAFGTSVRSSNEVLYNQIRQLTETRNSVVHRGIEVDEATARVLVAAAERLFEWLDAL